MTSNDSGNDLQVALQGRLETQRAEMEKLDGQIERLSATRARVAKETEHLEGLLAIYGPTGGSAVSQPRPVRRGQAEPDDVVDLLRTEGHPMHYLDIEAALRARGFATGGGVNPANSFLARYYKDPRLYRPSRGTYALKEWKSGGTEADEDE